MNDSDTKDRSEWLELEQTTRLEEKIDWRTSPRILISVSIIHKRSYTAENSLYQSQYNIDVTFVLFSTIRTNEFGCQTAQSFLVMRIVLISLLGKRTIYTEKIDYSIIFKILFRPLDVWTILAENRLGNRHILFPHVYWCLDRMRTYSMWSQTYSFAYCYLL